MKIFKYIVLLFAFAISSGYLQAQNTVLTGVDREATIEKIRLVYKDLSSLKANFTQEKHSSMFVEPLIQKGTMSYVSPSSLCWEYTSPQHIVIQFDKGNATMLMDGRKAAPNKALGELGKLIVRTLNGDNLVTGKEFEVSYEKNGKSQVIVVLKPVNKKMRLVCTQMEVTLDAKTYLADKVVIQEASGDKTEITFTKKKVNQ